MTAVRQNDLELQKSILEWKATIRKQQRRPAGERYPNDIGMIAQNTREYPNGIVQIYSAFPIYYKDKLEDVLRKYINCFPDEAIPFLEQVKAEKSQLSKESGMSELGGQRLGAVFPEKLYNIIKWYGKNIAKVDFFAPKEMKKIKELMPICFIGSLRDNDNK